MRESEFKKLSIIKKEGEFRPASTYIKEMPIIENEIIVDYELEGLVIHKTSEEVYKEYLQQLKDPTPEPVSEIEQLKSKNQMLESALLDLAETIGGI